MLIEAIAEIKKVQSLAKGPHQQSQPGDRPSCNTDEAGGQTGSNLCHAEWPKALTCWALASEADV